MDGPQEGVAVGAPRQPRENFADADPVHVGWNRPKRPANARRRFRFGVEGVKLARPADQIDPDDAEVRRSGGERVKLRQAEQPQRPGSQEISAMQAAGKIGMQDSGS
jgi:hypothetical protein